MDIHKRIIELINKRGWSLNKLATETGLYPTTVYNWFNDKHHTPDRNSIELICAALEISLTDFYTDIDIDKLTEKEIKLLKAFKNIPADKQDVVIIVAQALQKNGICKT